VLERLGLNLDLSTSPGEILKPLSDLRISLDLFADRSAIAAHQTLIRTSKPLGDHALVQPSARNDQRRNSRMIRCASAGLVKK
jgi:hypothetical protein